MPFRFDRKEQGALAWMLGKWILLGAWVGALAGAASYLFLKALEWATAQSAAQSQLLYYLPFAGVGIALLYEWIGKDLKSGNNLILDRIHEPDQAVPLRMAPLILITTVTTHLFGGSAGREGTAVQMGGTLANLISLPLKLKPEDRRLVLMAGVAGGFGSVFGTPLAGAIFGMEVLALGRLKYNALIPCLTASVVGALVCKALGLEHHLYAASAGPVPTMGPVLLGWLVVAGTLFAGASALFTELTHVIQAVAERVSNQSWLRAFVGGLVVVGLTFVVGNRDYNGLSLPLIYASFTTKVVLGAFLLKILFTAVTLGSGFKGGEVTPLFCIGATLGNAFAQVTHQPVGFFAALGFVAVFAGAANTPLACTVMGIELFGSELAVPLAITCVVSYVLSGHRGIYASQRVSHAKSSHVDVGGERTLREVREDGLAVNAGRFLGFLRRR